MRNGTCPGCHSSTVYKKKNGVKVGSGDGMYVYTGAVTMASDFEAYICTSCGYVELHVTDREKLQRVAESWDRVV